MDTLPTELHLLILSFLEPHEWRVAKYANYRLVSRRYADIGAQKMFETFQFRPSGAARERMERVVGSGVGRFVMCLDYDGGVEDEGREVEDGDVDDGMEERDGENEEHDGDIEDHDGETGDHNRDHSDLQRTVFRDVVLTFARAGSPIRWLAALHLHPYHFHPQNMTEEFVHACANLTTLDLHFDSETNMNVSSLHNMLAGMQHLEMLGLCFSEHKHWTNSWGSPPSLHNVLPLEHTWPKLRTLFLEYFTVTETDVNNLLKNLPHTLRCFHFKGFKLVRAEGSALYEEMDSQLRAQAPAWKSIFEQIGRIEGLKHGALSSFSKTADLDKAVWKVKMEGQDRHVEIETNLVKWLKDGDEQDEEGNSWDDEGEEN